MNNDEQKAETTTSSLPIGNNHVSGSGFRIVELDDKFTIEKEFTKSTYKWFLWWIIKEKKHKVCKRITKYGGECFFQHSSAIHISIDTYKDILPAFNTLEEAEKAVQKFINPPQPVYHYR